MVENHDKKVSSPVNFLSMFLAVVVVLLIAVVVCFVFAVAGGLCISGTKQVSNDNASKFNLMRRDSTFQRNHNRIKPLVIVLAVKSICDFLNIFKFTRSAVSSGLFFGCLYGYLFVCIYSLFYKIREEFERGLNAQYQLRVGNV